MSGTGLESSPLQQLKPGFLAILFPLFGHAQRRPRILALRRASSRKHERRADAALCCRSSSGSSPFGSTWHSNLSRAAWRAGAVRATRSLVFAQLASAAALARRVRYARVRGSLISPVQRVGVTGPPDVRYLTIDIVGGQAWPLRHHLRRTARPWL